MKGKLQARTKLTSVCRTSLAVSRRPSHSASVSHLDDHRRVDHDALDEYSVTSGLILLSLSLLDDCSRQQPLRHAIVTNSATLPARSPQATSWGKRDGLWPSSGPALSLSDSRCPQESCRRPYQEAHEHALCRHLWPNRCEGRACRPGSADRRDTEDELPGRVRREGRGGREGEEADGREGEGHADAGREGFRP
jgi:hypothetical protein